MDIPNDKYMLLSFINTKLRDEFDSLSNLCTCYQIDITEIEEKLASIGYKYQEDINQFRL